MRYRAVLFLIFAFCFSISAEGQQVFTLKGVTSKKLSGERVAQVVIIDLRSREMKMSDELGWFSISAAIGDTLLFSKMEYTDQKVTIINTADIPVYLQPIIHLAEVEVKGQSKRQELSDVMNSYRNKGIYFDGKPPVTAFLPFGGSPLTGLYELFGKEPKRLRRFAAFAKDETEYAELKKRYNLSLVKRVTSATDSTAKKFMEYYSPSYDDIKEWNDYELIKQIRREYDFYHKSGDKTGLQNLNSPALSSPAKKKKA
ncbi:MAG: hypothetical protein M3N14_06930 [Bacteroidota bacterium]|nr:hypothetical protein [Bacteroidota bacterium]